MIVHRSEMKTELKEKMRGGEGITSLVHLVDGASMKNARLLSEITLPPGASIGEHSHENETEYYIILSGTGVVVDDGIEKTVAQGDVVITGNGASHSIMNKGNLPLFFMPSS
ncbi:cupin domain-containing protein [Treponema sp.]